MYLQILIPIYFQIEEIKASLQRNVGMSWLVQEDMALQALLQRIDNWKWKMTAAGFFKVNRSLIGGVRILLQYLMYKNFMK